MEVQANLDAWVLSNICTHANVLMACVYVGVSCILICMIYYMHAYYITYNHIYADI